ncbi:MAG TPA: 16S rRNA (guanine(527)-N(7))-methyltransferase RsmG [Candidatus Limnocylindrales bacterium]
MSPGRPIARHPRCEARHAGSGPRRRPRAHPQEGCLGRQREPLPTRVEGLPELPADYGRVLDAGLASLHLTLPASARSAIDGHVRLLLAWNDAINLTAIRDPAEAARLHVVDSLTAVALLRARGIDRFVDIGSGGGLPGLPLSAALPADRALLVESVGKKARFLETAIAATGLADRTAVVAARAEDVARDRRDRERWPAVTARAIGSLAELVELAFPLLVPGGVLVAWKRGDIDDELVEAESLADRVGGGRFDVVEAGVPELAGHRLVVVEKLGPTGHAWPRDPAARRRSR